MTSDTLLEAMRARPFRSFVIEMADGRRIRVSHPELIAHKAGSGSAAVMRGDAYVMIELAQVRGLQFGAEKPGMTGKGSA